MNNRLIFSIIFLFTSQFIFSQTGNQLRDEIFKEINNPIEVIGKS